MIMHLSSILSNLKISNVNKRLALADLAVEFSYIGLEMRCLKTLSNNISTHIKPDKSTFKMSLKMDKVELRACLEIVLIRETDKLDSKNNVLTLKKVSNNCQTVRPLQAQFDWLMPITLQREK